MRVLSKGEQDQMSTLDHYYNTPARSRTMSARRKKTTRVLINPRKIELIYIPMRFFLSFFT